MTFRATLAALIASATLCAAPQVASSSLTILTPGPDDTLTGVVTFAADLRSAVAVRSVTFYVDGMRGCTATAAPYRCDWDTSPVRGGRDVRAVADLVDGTRVVQSVRTRGVAATFRASTDSIIVPVRVRDRQRRYVRGLDAAQFRILEDDVLQPIVTFGGEISGGDVVLALDASGSMTPALSELKAAVRGFLGALPKADMVTVAAFNTALGVLAPRGADAVSRVAALDRLRPEGSTAIYDVLIQAVDLFPAGVERRAIVMFTDGDDVSSRASVASARTALQDANVVLYVIAQGRAVQDRALRQQLTALTTETGGAAFFAPRMSNTRDHFSEIAEELSNQYLIGYIPTRPFVNGEWRAIRVEMTDAARRYEVVARQGYLATTGRQSPSGAQRPAR